VHGYSATQLIAKVEPGTAEEKVRAFAKKAIEDGLDHLLVIQADGSKVEYAALIPLPTLGDIWVAQRDKSAEMLGKGAVGLRKKNHAENGHSPTLYLHDAVAPDVSNILWTHAGVIDLTKPMTSVGTVPQKYSDDSFQDIFVVSYNALGSDAPELIYGMISSVKRDEKVRQAVMRRAGGKCERQGCGASRPYLGFLDVHHVVGVATSDRVWNCVALCPNCHREAHISPESAAINRHLLGYAKLSK